MSELSQPKKNITLSMTSFILTMLSIIAGALAFPIIFLPFSVFVFTIPVCFVAIVLGIISLVKKRDGMVVAILGITFSGCQIYWVLCVLLLMQALIEH